MSKARLVITAVVIGKRPVGEVIADYGISKSWFYELLARYREEGEAAFEPRSKRPKTSPNATPPGTVELIVRLRRELTDQGLDAGPDTIAWHLKHRHHVTVSRATVSRHLTAQGLVLPEPKKRPRSSYIRFAAVQPNETWQADFTHYRLTRLDGRPGVEVEILSWLDDCARHALSVRPPPDHRADRARHIPHNRGPVWDSRLNADGQWHGLHHPAGRRPRRPQRLRDRTAPTRGGAEELPPEHPTTCGKVERFQQTLKKWLHGQPVQPATVAELQTLLDRFVEQYNHHRPHRSLPYRATPATIYTSRPKAIPGDRAGDTHDRVRRDRIDISGKITLRYQGRLYSIGIGRTHARTRVLVLAQDLQVRIIDAATGELLRDLTLDPTKRYQGTGRPPGPPRK